MILEIKAIDTFYGLGHILHGLSLEVAQGEVVALLGRNGAGKTTTMRSVTGLTPPKKGEILYKGRNIAGLDAHRISQLGIALVPAIWLSASPERLWPLAFEAVLAGTLWSGHGIAMMDLTLGLSSRRRAAFHVAVIAAAGGLGFAAASVLAGALAWSLPARLVVGFRHRHRFEFDGTYWDGGVIEVSIDGGPFQDVSVFATPGYNATVDGSNPLGGRAAYGGDNPANPDANVVTLDFGTALAGRRVELRFRASTDAFVASERSVNVT